MSLLENHLDFSLERGDNAQYSFSEHCLPWPLHAGLIRVLQATILWFYFPLIHRETIAGWLLSTLGGPQLECTEQMPRAGKQTSVQAHPSLSSISIVRIIKMITWHLLLAWSHWQVSLSVSFSYPGFIYQPSSGREWRHTLLTLMIAGGEDLTKIGAFCLFILPCKQWCLCPED